MYAGVNFTDSIDESSSSRERRRFNFDVRNDFLWQFTLQQIDRLVGPSTANLLDLQAANRNGV